MHYRFAEFEVDTELRDLRCDGMPVTLQPQPFQLLCLLLAEAGRVVSREKIVQALWGECPPADVDQSISIAVRKLRDALGESPSRPRFVLTVPKVGYRLVAEVAAIAPPAGSGEHAEETLHSSATTSVVSTSLRLPTGLAFLVVVVASAGWLVREGQPSALSWTPRNTVLVSRFDDRTGDKSIDGAFEAFIESELGNSQAAGVTSPDRVDDALKLMRRKPSGRPTFQDAIEVCRRDSSIRAVIGGEVRRLGAAYLLSARFVDPATATTLISVNSEGNSPTELLPVLRTLVRSIRTRVGEALPQRPPQALDKATTESLDALRVFSEAHTLMRNSKWAAAEVLLREAVRLDPEFASAWVLLGWAIRSQHPTNVSKFAPFAEKAFALVDTVSEQEALFIRGSYHLLKGDFKEAIPFYEALIHLNPDHPWAVINLRTAYFQVDRPEKVDALSHLLLTVRPNHPFTYWLNADLCLCPPEDPRKADLKLALQFVDRAIELTRQQEDADSMTRTEVQSAIVKAVVAWRERNISRFAAELDRGSSILPRLPNDIYRVGYTHEIGGGYLALGKLRRAQQLLAGVELEPSSVWRFIGDSLWRRKGGDSVPVDVPRSVPQFWRPFAAIAMLRAGIKDPAERWLRKDIRLEYPILPKEWYGAAQAELLMYEHRYKEAVDQLRISFASTPFRNAFQVLGAQTFARALVAQGQVDEAIEVLEKATAPRSCGRLFGAAVWPHASHDLMQLYRMRGRNLESKALEEELRRITAVADSDFVL